MDSRRWKNLFVKTIQSDADLLELRHKSGSSLIVRVVGIALSYAFAFLVIQYVGATGWGVLSLCIAVVTFSAVIAKVGLEVSAVRFLSEYLERGEHEKVWNTYVQAVLTVGVLALVVALIQYMVSPLIAESVFKKPHLTRPFEVSALAVPAIAVMALNAAYLRAAKMAAMHTFFGRVARFVFPLCILVLIAKMSGAIDQLDVVVSWVLGCTVGAVLSFFVVWKEIKCFSFRFDNADYWNLLKVGLSLLLVEQLLFLKGYIDTIMLGGMVADNLLGTYSIALRLAMLVQVPLLAVRTIALPKLAVDHVRIDASALELTLKKSHTISMIAAFPVFIMLVSFPTFWLGLFGVEFMLGRTALVLLLIGKFVGSGMGIADGALSMTGQQNTLQGIVAAVIAVGVLLNILLIPRLGIVGAAISTLVSGLLYNLLCAAAVRWKFRIWAVGFHSPGGGGWCNGRNK